MVDLNENFKKVKNDIFSHMLRTRGSKYKWFLRALRSFKYVSMNPTKGTFLESYYTLMRYVDDVADCDAKLPKGYKSPDEFVNEKIEFAKHPKNPKDSVDYLMLYCFELADKFKEEFSEETQDILSSMLFDAKRYGKMQVFPENELSYHFHLLDVRGTISATLKVFGEDSRKYPLLQPLGLASRIYYNLRDYDEDIKAGLVNIPAEDCQRFNISSIDLENRLSYGIQNWFIDQAKKGVNLLDEHKTNEGQFGYLARITFPLVYEKPARKCFEKVLKN